jgi:hypothetical protein
MKLFSFSYSAYSLVGETGTMWDISFLYAAIYIKIKILKKLKYRGDSLTFIYIW